MNPLQMSCAPRCACSPADFHVSAAAQVWTCKGRVQWSGQRGVDVVQIELLPPSLISTHGWRCIHPAGQLRGFAGKLNNETQWCVMLDSLFKWPQMVYPHLVLGATVYWNCLFEMEQNWNEVWFMCWFVFLPRKKKKKKKVLLWKIAGKEAGKHHRERRGVMLMMMADLPVKHQCVCVCVCVCWCVCHSR